MMRRISIGGLLLLAVVFRAVVIAQSGAANTAPIVWTGVYSLEQADRGKAVVAAHCAPCHGSSQPLSGDIFMLHWQGRDVARLFQKIKDTMPPRNQSAMVGENDKLDAVAFILQQNGFPQGAGDLQRDEAALAQIKLVPREGVPQLRSGSVVRAFGCLQRGEGSVWKLVSSTAPEPTELDSWASTDAPANVRGTGTIELLNPFPSPTALLGKIVQVQGFLIRDASGDQINVIALALAAESCGP